MVAHCGQLMPQHEYKEQGARQCLQRLGAYRSFALLRAHQVQSFAKAPPSAPGPARALYQQRAQPACDESATGTLMEAIALRQPRSPLHSAEPAAIRLARTGAACHVIACRAGQGNTRVASALGMALHRQSSVALPGYRPQLRTPKP